MKHTRKITSTVRTLTDSHISQWEDRGGAKERSGGQDLPCRRFVEDISFPNLVEGTCGEASRTYRGRTCVHFTGATPRVQRSHRQEKESSGEHDGNVMWMRERKGNEKKKKKALLLRILKEGQGYLIPSCLRRTDGSCLLFRLPVIQGWRTWHDGFGLRGCSLELLSLHARMQPRLTNQILRNKANIWPNFKHCINRANKSCSRTSVFTTTRQKCALWTYGISLGWGI